MPGSVRARPRRTTAVREVRRIEVSPLKLTTDTRDHTVAELRLRGQEAATSRTNASRSLRRSGRAAAMIAVISLSLKASGVGDVDMRLLCLID
jgi:hypothetical protein